MNTRRHFLYSLTASAITARTLSAQEKVVRTSFRPGSQIPVKDGQLVLTPPEAKK